MSDTKFVVTEDTLISDIIEYDEELEAVLLGFGLHCFSCPMHTLDRISDAAEVHGIDADLLIQKLNEAINEKNSK